MQFRPTLRAVAMFAIAPLLPAQDPILQRLPADTAQLLVIRDPLPRIEAILAAPGVREMLAGSADLQRELNGMAMDAAALSRQLGLFRNLIPTEIVVAAPPTAGTDLLRIGYTAVCVAVLQAIGKNADKDLIDNATTACQQCVDALRPPELTGWVTTRDERTAESWFDSIADWAGKLPLMDGLEIDFADSRITARIRPFDLHLGMLRSQLGRFGVKVPADRTFQIDAVLEQSGNRLQLRVGDPGKGQAPVERMGAQWLPEALVYLRHDVGDGEVLVVEAAQLISQALDADLEEQAAELLLRVMAAVERLLVLGPVTTASLVVGETTAWTVEADMGEDLPDDEPSAATLRALTPESGPFLLTEMTADMALLSLYEEFETRAMQRADRAGSMELFEWLGTHLSGAVDYLGSEESSVFQPGTLVSVRSAGFRGCKAMAIGEMPFFSVTMIAKVADAASGRQFVETLTARLAEASGVDPKKVWAEADLGVGEPTFAFAWELIPGFADLGLDADLRPHWLIVDDHLLFGTDPAGSKAMVARMRGTATTPLPATSTFAWMVAEGKHLSAAGRGIAAWAQALAGRGANRGEAELTRRVGEMVAALMHLVERYESHTTVDGSVMRERTILRARQR